eukprot:scaffold163855_cov47-Prasinocladus_malaysianus.AAC.1
MPSRLSSSAPELTESFSRPRVWAGMPGSGASDPSGEESADSATSKARPFLLRLPASSMTPLIPLSCSNTLSGPEAHRSHG